MRGESGLITSAVTATVASAVTSAVALLLLVAALLVALLPVASSAMSLLLVASATITLLPVVSVAMALLLVASSAMTLLLIASSAMALPLVASSAVTLLLLVSSSTVSLLPIGAAVIALRTAAAPLLFIALLVALGSLRVVLTALLAIIGLAGVGLAGDLVRHGVHHLVLAGLLLLRLVGVAACRAILVEERLGDLANHVHSYVMMRVGVYVGSVVWPYWCSVTYVCASVFVAVLVVGRVVSVDPRQAADIVQSIAAAGQKNTRAIDVVQPSRLFRAFDVPTLPYRSDSRSHDLVGNDRTHIIAIHIQNHYYHHPSSRTTMVPLTKTRKLMLIIAISLCFFLAEIAVGFYTHSLALVADAFHYVRPPSCPPACHGPPC